MGLRNKLTTMGMFPDVGKLTDMFDQKFNALVAKLDEIKTVLIEIRDKQSGQALIILMIVVVFIFTGLFMACLSGDDKDSLGKIQLVNHERSRCYDEYDCDDYGRGGDGGESGGHQGYGGGGGRSGDYDGGPGDDCRNFCGNTIIVPTPGQRPGSLGCLVPFPFHCDPKPEVVL